MTHPASRRAGVPNLVEVAKRWDHNAQTRFEELTTNSDPSYRALKHMATRWLTSMYTLRDAPILDAGCGVGSLTGHLASCGYTVEGVDCSRESVRYARLLSPNCTFTVSAVEDHAATHPDQFGGVVANMVLQSVPNGRKFLRACADLLVPGGVLIALLPHPAFYLADRDWLQPNEVIAEQALELPFKVHGGEPHPERVWHFHRPVSYYVNAVAEAGLGEIRAEEPYQVGPGRAHDIFLLAARKTVAAPNSLREAISAQSRRALEP
jgi:SAM-dependent methyltransferase